MALRYDYTADRAITRFAMAHLKAGYENGSTQGVDQLSTAHALENLKYKRVDQLPLAAQRVMQQMAQHAIARAQGLDLDGSPLAKSMTEALEQHADAIYADTTPDDGLGICTVGARAMAEMHGGKVKGYFHEDNPTAAIGKDEGGHDFAVLHDRYIVDPWHKHMYGHPNAVHDLKNPAHEAAIKHLYGDPATWSTVADHTPKATDTSLTKSLFASAFDLLHTKR